MMQQDFLLRRIEQLAQSIARVFFHRDQEQNPEAHIALRAQGALWYRDVLARGGFSREEIAQGLTDAARVFGLDLGAD